MLDMAYHNAFQSSWKPIMRKREHFSPYSSQKFIYTLVRRPDWGIFSLN